MKRFFMLSLLLITTGCAMTPYESEFTKCPGVDPGKCGSITDAYVEALDTPPTDISKVDNALRISEQKKNGNGLGASDLFEDYQTARMRKEIRYLNEPQTPLVTPATVMRILFRPYKGDNGELNMSRFTYEIVEEPRFIIGDEVDESGLQMEGGD